MSRRRTNKDAEQIATLATMETVDLERLVEIGQALLRHRRRKATSTPPRPRKTPVATTHGAAASNEA